jgi:RimJ/RimL family protein N-acetyltransferase
VVLHQLRNGRIVSIRAIRSDDRERLRESHARLSPESRYRRFMAAKPVLSISDARYLVDVDGYDHVALVATVAEPEGEAIVGVGRFIRLAEQPDVAEFAIVVGDDWQGQGLGADLLARLGEAARQRGIGRFRASILLENTAIRRLIDRYADGKVDHLATGTVCEVEFSLPASSSIARAA